MRSARCLSGFVRLPSRISSRCAQKQCAALSGSLSRAAPIILPGGGGATSSRGVLQLLLQRPFSDRPGRKQSKVKKKNKPQGKAGEAAGRSKELELILASLDAPIRKEGPISQEERDRRHQVGRDYVIGRFREHNELDHDLTCKMHLKRHALDMLKHHPRLRDEALRIDDDQVAPLWRHMPVWTPPIPGFDPSQFIDKDKDDK